MDIIAQNEERSRTEPVFQPTQKKYMRISLSSQKMIAKKLIFEAKKLERALKATFLLAVFFEKSYTLENPWQLGLPACKSCFQCSLSSFFASKMSFLAISF